MGYGDGDGGFWYFHPSPPQKISVEAYVRGDSEGSCEFKNVRTRRGGEMGCEGKGEGEGRDCIRPPQLAEPGQDE